jgi:uncharacterized protein YecA (UPF0149 family)
MKPLDFLNAELDHAQRHLARIRRIQTKMLSDLEQTGLDEVTVYERLIATKAYRQLQRDESFYQRMWLRLSRELAKLSQTPPQTKSPLDEQLGEYQASLARTSTKPKPQTVRYETPKPGRNEPCPCGSTLKYKRCCGNSLPQAA